MSSRSGGSVGKNQKKKQKNNQHIQERTLRREVDLLKKEINVLKYESDLDLPCLRNCIMRLLLCQRHEVFFFFFYL